jgi:hypothetical protein
VAVAKQAHADDMRNSRRFTTNLPMVLFLAGSLEPGPTLARHRSLPCGEDTDTSKGQEAFSA